MVAIQLPWQHRQKIKGTPTNQMVDVTFRITPVIGRFILFLFEILTVARVVAKVVTMATTPKHKTIQSPDS